MILQIIKKWNHKVLLIANEKYMNGQQIEGYCLKLHAGQS